jgi:hypothetical protein
MKNDVLDTRKMGKDMVAFGHRVHNLLTKAVEALSGIAEQEYPDVMTLFPMLQIYSHLMQKTWAAREALIEVLGGRPTGEAKLRYFEKRIKATVLKHIQDEDFDRLIGE